MGLRATSLISQTSVFLYAVYFKFLCVKIVNTHAFKSMIGRIFGPHDIRSKMGHTNKVVPGGVTREATFMEIVPMLKAPTPLKFIVPGELENEIDFDNTPKFLKP